MASIVIGDYTYNTNGSVSVVDKTKQSYGSILSSFEYGGQTYDVTDMSYCFYECVNLIKAPTIPEGITNMSSCFEDCVSLIETPTIPTSVEDLSYCFFRCTSLKYADDFRLTTTPVLKNMAGCFAYCTSLTKAPRQIPRSVTTLRSCFLDCKSLKRSPQSIYSIVSSGTDSLNMEFCFKGCESLETAPVLPDKVTNLSNCFDGCINLTNVSRLPKNVTDVSHCFDGCRSLQGNIEVQNVPEYSGGIFANLFNQNIYIINIADSEIKEDVAEEWRSIANQYRSVHYEADDHGAPTITLSAKRSNNDGESSSTGRYITVTKQYNYNLDNLPVGKGITLTESMELDSVLITPASSEPGESITFTIPQEINDLSHTVVYTVNDGYKTTTQTVEISKVIALLDFFGNPPDKKYKSDVPGMGMAIGKLSTRNGLDIEFPTTIGYGLTPTTKAKFELTKDTEIIEGKTYYIKTEDYGYEVVEEPVQEDLEFYYEFVGRYVDLENYQLIIGRYNEPNSEPTFIVGNGDELNRSNLMEVGDIITFGPSDGSQSYIRTDYHSLQMIDDKSNSYFYISDLRNKDGELIEDYISTQDQQENLTTRFKISHVSYLGVEGHPYEEGIDYTYSSGENLITFITKPNKNDLIDITYTPLETISTKAYTLGIRKEDGLTGGFSTVIGYDNIASGFNSYAEGNSTTASGIGSHAEGRSTTASGDYAHAEGALTTASDDYSHAEGFRTIASSDYSHAQNLNTVAGYEAQTTIGKYNDNQSDTAFEIGNGSLNGGRSNALTVDWNGNIVTKDLELTRGTIPASSNYRDKIVFTDSNDTTLGYIRTPFLTDGREGIQIETTRTVNGSAIYNGIQMYINASGTPSVTLNHPAAWRTALGLGDLATLSSLSEELVTQNWQTGAIKIASGATMSNNGTLSVAKSGYTPLCIVNDWTTNVASGGGTSGMHIFYKVLSGTTITYNVRNMNASGPSNVYLNFTVLYRKN